MGSVSRSFKHASGYLAWAFGVQKGIPRALTEPELRALQLARLNETLVRAKRSSHFFETHLPKNQLSSLDELKNLPLMSSTIFNEGFERLLCVSAKDVSRMVTLSTSGTSGVPKRIAFTQNDHAETIEYFAAGMRMLAAEGESIAVLYPCETPGSMGQLICESIKSVPARAVPYGVPQSFSALAECFAIEQVRGIVGFPQHIFAFARWCEHYAVDLDLRAVLLSADNAGAVLTQEIERIWDAQVYRHFGMTEFAYGGAVECDLHNGCHIRETDLLFEVIDPVTLEPLPDGEWGELVFTTINQQAMPLIRYRTGDMTRFLAGECPCGSILRRIDNVKGRMSDSVQIGERTFGMPELEDALFAIPGVVDFKASFAGGHKAGSSRLHLLVQGLEQSPVDEETVTAGLHRTEPFATLLSHGLMRLDVQVERVTDAAFLYKAKRYLEKR